MTRSSGSWREDEKDLGQLVLCWIEGTGSRRKEIVQLEGGGEYSSPWWFLHFLHLQDADAELLG